MGEAVPDVADSYQRIIRRLPNKNLLDTNLVRVLYPETLQPIDNNSPEGKELNAAFDARKTKAGYRQEGGEIPSNDQQQLFISIITDMAQVLGVEPSQELAEAVLTAFENNDDSEGLLTLFTQIKDKRMQDTGLFKQGGKINTFVQKFKCGGKKTKVKKAALGDQIGGKISDVSRSTMFDDAEEFMPEADRKFVRGAYRTAKNHGRDLGLTGRSLRNWAKGQVSDRFRNYADKPMAQQAQQLPQIPVLSDDIVIEDEPIVFEDPFKDLDTSTPVVKPIETRPK